MATLTVFDHLALHPFLGDLPSPWLYRLSAHGRPVMWPATRRVFREDAPAENFWLLCSGAVVLDFHVPGRGDVVIERIGADGVLGWSWLIEPRRWTLGAVAAEDCRAIEFGARGVRNLLAEDPDLGREVTSRFVEVMAARLQAARHRLVELYAYPEGMNRRV
jgi:CRP/FNR family transcriptional regulator, cyclic AMP receptor protein